MRWLWVLVLLAVPLAHAGPVVLIYHPVDGTDPFGVAGSPFETRYPGAAIDGRFDYPTFIADGTDIVRVLPNPDLPFTDTVAAYEAALARRSAVEAPVQLMLGSALGVDNVTASVAVQPKLQMGLPQSARIYAALVEDNVFQRSPSPVSNGIENHRFTVRAFADLGRLEQDGLWRETTWMLNRSWDRDELSVAAWVQAETQSGSYAEHEVLQAAQVKPGLMTVATERNVLLEMLSATWCDPCLYGDLALEDVAIRAGVAEPAPRHGQAYDARPSETAWVVAGVTFVGLLVAMRRRT